MSLRDLINQGTTYSRNTSANTYFTTSYMTTGVTSVNTSRITSRVTGHYTNVQEGRAVYTLGSISSLTNGSGWYAGDLANVYMSDSNTQPAPGYGYRVVRIDSVTSPGGQFTGHSIVAEGGYYAVNGGSVNMSSGVMQAPSGVFSSFSGGLPTGQLGTIYVNTSAYTSYSTLS